jgi:hypothetical protein
LGVLSLNLVFQLCIQQDHILDKKWWSEYISFWCFKLIERHRPVHGLEWSEFRQEDIYNRILLFKLMLKLRLCLFEQSISDFKFLSVNESNDFNDASLHLMITLKLNIKTLD